MRQTALIPSLGKLTPGQIFFGKRKISTRPSTLESMLRLVLAGQRVSLGRPYVHAEWPHIYHHYNILNKPSSYCFHYDNVHTLMQSFLLNSYITSVILHPPLNNQKRKRLMKHTSLYLNFVTLIYKI